MEQLQKALEKAVGIGFLKLEIYSIVKVLCDINGSYFISWDESVHNSMHLSYHDLFSKDYGLMELMEWDGGLLNAYKEMSYLTAQDKIIYFNTYSKLPGC